MKEIWKTIEEFPAYAVSNLGRVKRAVDSERWPRAGLIKTPYFNSNGYLRVALVRDRKRYNVFVHRIVAKTFLPNPLNLPQVNHKGEKIDNRDWMLEWISKADHRIDMIKRHQQSGDGVPIHPFGKYQVYFPDPKAPGKRLYLGWFSTKEEGLKARKEAMEKFYGDKK